jgi:hypothetical protein
MKMAAARGHRRSGTRARTWSSYERPSYNRICSLGLSCTKSLLLYDIYCNIQSPSSVWHPTFETLQTCMAGANNAATVPLPSRRTRLPPAGRVLSDTRAVSRMQAAPSGTCSSMATSDSMHWYTTTKTKNKFYKDRHACVKIRCCEYKFSIVT